MNKNSIIFTKENDLTKQAAIFIGICAFILKLILSYTQYATVYPPLAPIDDQLMFKAAQSIVNGQWLGQYSCLTLSKHMFFAVWLAFLNVIKVPYLVGNMALWGAASLSLTAALAPAMKRRWAKLFLFLGLLYNPAVSAQFSTRVYRDSIFPSLCVLFFAGIAAVGLRYKQSPKKWMGWLVMYGTAFGTIYLCREDGIWVMPFAAVALAVIIFLIIKEKHQRAAAKISAVILPFALSALVIGAYCKMNYDYYGRFVVSDFTSGEFKAAYGALAGLKQDSWNPMVAVPEDVREDVYREVPSFAPVKKALEKPLIVGGYKNPSLGDFSSGAFYWALREALSDLGVYATPQSAKQYYENLTRQIQAAVNEGRLETQNGSKKLRKSLTPPIRAEYIPDVFVEWLSSIKVTILFEQCDPLAQAAVGTSEETGEVESFIHQSGATAMKENTSQPYLSPIRLITHKFLRIMNMIYKICIPFMVAISAIWQIKQLKDDLANKKFSQSSMLNIIMLGFLGMMLLRCAMIAFVEVASFGIGTYAMYLSTAHPLLIAYGFAGFCKTFEY